MRSGQELPRPLAGSSTPASPIGRRPDEPPALRDDAGGRGSRVESGSSSGIDRFALYGQLGPTRPGVRPAHPDRLSALILDGAVDLTLSSNDFWSAAARSFERSLEATFDACVDDRSCGAGRRPVGHVRRAVASLESGDRMIRFGDPDGVVREHTLGRATVESAVAALLYEPAGRMLVQRAVAAAANGDDVPMAKLAALAGPGISPVSTFAYHAILCADYRVSPTAETDDFDAVLANGQKSGALYTRTDQIYLAQVPCLYWPDQPPTSDRPAAITDLPAPIMVLGATLDPITPVELGRSIAGAGGRRLPHRDERRAPRDVRTRQFLRGRARGSTARVRDAAGEPIDLVLRRGRRAVHPGRLDRRRRLHRRARRGGHDPERGPDRAAGAVLERQRIGHCRVPVRWDPAGLAGVRRREGRVQRLRDGRWDGLQRHRRLRLRIRPVALDITFDGGSLTYASGPDGSLTGTFRGRPVDGDD